MRPVACLCPDPCLKVHRPPHLLVAVCRRLFTSASNAFGCATAPPCGIRACESTQHQSSSVRTAKAQKLWIRSRCIVLRSCCDTAVTTRRAARLYGGLVTARTLRTCGIPFDGVDLISVTFKGLEGLRLSQLAHMDHLVCAAGCKGGVVPPVHVQCGRCRSIEAHHVHTDSGM